jgi:hypothetical protein
MRKTYLAGSRRDQLTSLLNAHFGRFRFDEIHVAVILKQNHQCKIIIVLVLK